MNKLSDEMVAGLIWNTLYPQRKKFSDLDATAKEEWIRFGQIARSVFALENVEEALFQEAVKSIRI
jgi:hypothetical protein